MTIEFKVTDRHDLSDGSMAFICTHGDGKFNAYLVLPPSLGVEPKILTQRDTHEHCLELVDEAILGRENCWQMMD
jgi:hypothetical protein